MREKDIEAQLVKRVKAIGGKAYKFVSPGNAGVPDRLVCLPGGEIFFVELKAPGEKPTVLQNKQLELLTGLGCRTSVIDSMEQIEQFITHCRLIAGDRH